MAKLNRSYVIIRFGFGTSNVKARQRVDDTTRYAVKRIAFSFAKDEYDNVRKTLEQGVEKDIRRELVNLASQYRRFIVGANGNTSKPAGVLHGVFSDTAALPLAQALPPWAPRDAQYLGRKKFNGAGNSWFDNRGWRGKRDAGLLFKESRADTWETMFGPIRVRFFRDNISTDPDVVVKVTKDKHVQMQIGTLRVYALGRLTPQMLPALNNRGGNIPVPSTAGNPGLAQLVFNYDRKLGGRLFQTSTKTHQYRPTLEPFLSYFLTRSVPSAMQRRIAEGSLKRLNRI